MSEAWSGGIGFPYTGPGVATEHTAPPSEAVTENEPQPRQFREPGDFPEQENPSICESALAAVRGERGRDYDHPSRNFDRIRQLWTAWLRETGKLADGAEIDRRDVAMLNVLQKVAREMHAPKRDSWVDIAGYSETVGMAVPFSTGRK